VSSVTAGTGRLVHPTNEAFADIREEIEAEAAADPTKKKLGVFFWVCAVFIVSVAALATLANLLPLPNPDLGNYNSVQNGGPGWGHLLGTDDLYRDILSRLIYGARVSLIVGFGGALLGLVIGGIPAMISAYRRGRVDTILNTGSYVLLAFPAIVAVIAIVSFWGHSLLRSRSSSASSAHRSSTGWCGPPRSPTPRVTSCWRPRRWAPATRAS